MLTTMLGLMKFINIRYGSVVICPDKISSSCKIPFMNADVIVTIMHNIILVFIT